MNCRVGSPWLSVNPLRDPPIERAKPCQNGRFSRRRRAAGGGRIELRQQRIVDQFGVGASLFRRRHRFDFGNIRVIYELLQRSLVLLIEHPDEHRIRDALGLDAVFVRVFPHPVGVFGRGSLAEGGLHSGGPTVARQHDAAFLNDHRPLVREVRIAQLAPVGFPRDPLHLGDAGRRGSVSRLQLRRIRFVPPVLQYRSKG